MTNLTDERFPGNLTRSYRFKSPLKNVGELGRRLILKKKACGKKPHAFFLIIVGIEGHSITHEYGEAFTKLINIFGETFIINIHLP